VSGPLDDFLRLVTDGLPPVAKRYELRCHPDVLHALHEMSAADPDAYRPGQPATPLYGTADVITDGGLQPGCWDLREDGKVIRQAFRGPDGELYVHTPAPIGFGPSWRE
jgi:hypothetical protein